MGAPPANLRRPASDENHTDDSVLSPWLPHSPLSELLALTRSQRPSAPVQLATLLEGSRARGDEEAAVIAVRALAPWTKTSRPARQALLEHLRSADTSGSATPLDVSRRTAAIALAWSHHEDAVRPLLLFSHAPQGVSPRLSAWAKHALDAYPPPENLRERVLKTFGLNPAPPNEPSPPACRSLVLPSTDGAARSWLLDLTRCSLGGFEAPAERWKLLQRAAPATALRAAALLIGRGWPVQPWMAASARQSLRADDAIVRSAAAWLLSLAEPAQLGSLLRSSHPEVRASALNQVFAGTSVPSSAEQSEEVMAAVASASASAPPELRRAWLALPPLWNEHSTLEILTLFRSARDPDRIGVLAPWASRLAADERALGPSPASVLAELRTASTLERAELVVGLGAVPQTAGALASKSASQRALGLLRRQYDQESHPGVRRLTCQALAHVLASVASDQGVAGNAKATPHSVLTAFAKEVETYDPDPACRALFSGDAPPPAGSSVLVAWTASPGLWVARHLAPPLYLGAAPDGFVGAATTVALGSGEKKRKDAGALDVALFSQCPSPLDGACDWPELKPP